MQTQYLGNIRGPVGPAGPVNPDSAPADTAVGQWIATTGGSATKTALMRRIPSAFHSFAGVPDGPVPSPHTFDSGHDFTLFDLSGSYTVAGGALVHPITASTTAAYLDVELGSPVRSMWFEVMWTDNGQPGEELAVLIVSPERFVPGASDFPNAGGHILFDRDGWTIQKFIDGDPVVLMEGSIPTPGIQYDQWYRFGLTFDGVQVTLHFPDGSTYTAATDPDVAAYWGEHAVFESFSTGNLNPVSIRNITATSDMDITTPRIASGHATWIKTPPVTNLTLTTPYQTVQTLTVTVPKSKALAVVSNQYVEHTGDGNLYGRINLGGNATSTSDMTLLQGQSYKGVVTLVGVLNLTEFTVGQVYDIHVDLSATGTCLQRVNGTNSWRQSIVATPVEGTFS